MFDDVDKIFYSQLGMYYTTPIYSFRMKCHLCPNKITIKTDPGNMDYVITEVDNKL